METLSNNQIFFLLAFLSPFLFGITAYVFFKKCAKEDSNHRWIKFVAGNILIFLFLLSTVFCLLETYYRYFYDSSDSSDSFSMTLVSKRWFSRYYKINNFNLRDNVNYRHKLISSDRRITFLGDSFTAGHGIKNVNKRFANIVRRIKGGQWEIHVLAINGIDTGAEIENIIKLIKTGYELDDVVLVYCLNDVADLLGDRNDFLGKINIQPEKENFFIKNSYFINTLYYRIKVLINPDVSNYFSYLIDAYDNQIWEIQKRRIMYLRDMIKNNGGKLRVVIFPFLHSISTSPEYEFRMAHEKLDQLLRDLKVPYIDLLPMFEKYHPKKLTVNSYDAHPSEFAHSKAAE